MSPRILVNIQQPFSLKMFTTHKPLNIANYFLGASIFLLVTCNCHSSFPFLISVVWIISHIPGSIRSVTSDPFCFPPHDCS